MVYNANKNLKLYYSIGEVAKMFDVPETTLRFWEKSFPTYLTPRKSGRQIRQYAEENLEQVRVIHYLLKERKLTMEGARQVLASNKKATVQEMEVLERLKGIREELMAMKRELDQTLY